MTENDSAPLCRKTLELPPWTVASCGLYWRRIDLDVEPPSAPSVLSEDERDRARRFVSPRDRRQYVAARTALRLAISDVLDRNPKDIRFTYGQHGKPRLADDVGWHFNLSHSGNIGVIAIGSATVVGEVGIDVERVVPVEDWRHLAASNFSVQECRELDTLAHDDLHRSFLECWSRKEACVKALGVGLNVPTSDFTVGLRGDAEVSISYDGVEHPLAVKTIPVGEDCVGAIAWSYRTGALRVTL